MQSCHVSILYVRRLHQCSRLLLNCREQHTEKQIQQYHERTHRAFQLTSEMEAAGLAESMKEKMLKLLRQKESRYMRLKRQRMNISMFDQIRHIGVGAFGTVTLVTKAS